MFHHPFNWLEATSGRALRKRLEGVADLVLTGHEHDPDYRAIQTLEGASSAYFEGGLLQDPRNPNTSSFNVFLVDTSTSKFKFAQYAWDEQRYVIARATRESQQSDIDWSAFEGNQLSRRVFRFEISPEMEAYLDDPGIPLFHRDRETMKLSDVFVAPDVVHLSYDVPASREIRDIDDLLPLVIDEPLLLISGDAQSGKTSLAKHLFKQLLELGRVPIMVNCEDRAPRGEALFRLLEDEFSKQYETDKEAYRQLDRGRRVVIVDDLDKLKGRSKHRTDFIRSLMQFAGTVILLANEFELNIDEITAEDAILAEFARSSHYRILPFGHAKRDRLIKRWLELSDDTELELAATLDRITGIVNTLVGKNFVPSFPTYIMPVLQAYEAAVPVDLSASTHGYFYELLIRANLSRDRGRSEYDIALAYLAHLAYSMFQLGVKRLSSAELRDVDRDYESKYDIRISGNDFRNLLVKQGILAVSDGNYRFRYPYTYYYFVASHLRDHIHEHDVLNAIKALTQRMFHEESANILLFLAHLSKDPLVIEELLAAAEKIHVSQDRADMIQQCEMLMEIGAQPLAITYVDRDPGEVREQILETLDRTEREREPRQPDDEFDPTGPVGEIVRAARALEILGQILKNFPGSLEGTLKVKIASRCWDLGLKTLKLIFDVLHDSKVPLLNNMFEAFRSEYPYLGEEEAWERARETVVGMAYALTFAIVKKISMSVGSPELANTYDKVLAEWEVPSTQLVHLSLQLDQSGGQVDQRGGFPENRIEVLAQALKQNILAMTLLRLLTVNHFYLFHVDFRTKQSTCASLDIPYKEIQQMTPSPRLLPAPKA